MDIKRKVNIKALRKLRRVNIKHYGDIKRKVNIMENSIA